MRQPLKPPDPVRRQSARRFRATPGAGGHRSACVSPLSPSLRSSWSQPVIALARSRSAIACGASSPRPGRSRSGSTSRRSSNRRATSRPIARSITRPGGPSGRPRVGSIGSRIRRRRRRRRQRQRQRRSRCTSIAPTPRSRPSSSCAGRPAAARPRARSTRRRTRAPAPARSCCDRSRSRSPTTPHRKAARVSSKPAAAVRRRQAVLHRRIDADHAAADGVRQQLLARLAAEGTRVFAFHFPFPGLGRVAPEGQGFVWKPACDAACR